MKHFFNDLGKVEQLKQFLGLNENDAKDADILDQLLHFLYAAGDSKTALIQLIELLLERIRRNALKEKINENYD